MQFMLHVIFTTKLINCAPLLLKQSVKYPPAFPVQPQLFHAINLLHHHLRLENSMQQRMV